MDVPFSLPARTRRTFKLDDIPWFGQSQVSLKVVSEDPMIAERTMYFSYRGIPGGTASCGSNEPNDKWYLAEGYTAEGFDTYVLLYNLSEKQAEVTLEFQDDSGQIISEQRTVGAGSRDTIYCDNVIPAISFSTKVTSTNGEPILVERAMYFNFKGRLDGHAGAAVCEPSASWYFGEGYTGY